MKIRVLDKPAEAVQTTWEGVTRDRVKQWAILEIDGLPTAFQVTSDPGKELAPGDYDLAPQSFGVQNGRLVMTRPVLVPHAAPAARAVPSAASK